MPLATIADLEELASYMKKPGVSVLIPLWCKGRRTNPAEELTSLITTQKRGRRIMWIAGIVGVLSLLPAIAVTIWLLYSYPTRGSAPGILALPYLGICLVTLGSLVVFGWRQYIDKFSRDRFAENENSFHWHLGQIVGCLNIDDNVFEEMTLEGYGKLAEEILTTQAEKVIEIERSDTYKERLPAASLSHEAERKNLNLIYGALAMFHLVRPIKMYYLAAERRIEARVLQAQAI